MAKLSAAAGVRSPAVASAAPVPSDCLGGEAPDNGVYEGAETAVQGIRILAALAIMSNHWTDYHAVGVIPQQQIAVDFFFADEGLLAGRALVRASDAASATVTI